MIGELEKSGFDLLATKPRMFHDQPQQVNREIDGTALDSLVEGELLVPIQSLDYEPGVSGFRFDPVEGTVEMN